jgi:hypothetical protein
MENTETLKVVIDSELRIIKFPYGSVTLNIPFEDWEDFVVVVENTNLVFQTNSESLLFECPSCGTAGMVIDYQEPSEEELN